MSPWIEILIFFIWASVFFALLMLLPIHRVLCEIATTLKSIDARLQRMENTTVHIKQQLRNY